jgi:hypothetical protein
VCVCMYVCVCVCGLHHCVALCNLLPDSPSYLCTVRSCATLVFATCAQSRYDNAVEAGGPDLKDHPLCVRCFNARARVCVCVCVCFVSVRVRVWTGGITWLTWCIFLHVAMVCGATRVFLFVCLFGVVCCLFASRSNLTRLVLPSSCPTSARRVTVLPCARAALRGIQRRGCCSGCGNEEAGC